jgi:nucleoside 2-deoxyribosyltransferase
MSSSLSNYSPGGLMEAKTIYLAGPLFSNAERQWNKKLRDYLEQNTDYNVYLPQDKCEELDPKNKEGDRKKLFRICEKGVQDADIVVAILDGADVDSGTAWEVGYARGIGKKIIGIRTDFRLCEVVNVNIMLFFGVDIYITDFSGDNRKLFNKIKKALERIEKDTA